VTSDTLLTLRALWSGGSLPEADWVTVELSLHHLAPTSAEEEERTGGWGSRELRIAIDAPLWGDPAPPPSNHPRRAYEGLWDYEVVEIFIGGAGGRDAMPYLELEFGPHGHALGLCFEGYRHRRERFEVECEAWQRGRRWRLGARVPEHRLPPGPWTANAFAMHGVGPERRHLAAHPGLERALDFHDAAAWRPLPLVWPRP